MKRLRASERVEITLRPRRISSSQSVGSGCRVSRLAQAAGNRFDGSQRVVQLVPEHAHQPLPGLQLLLAQRQREIRQHQQLQRQARARGRWCGGSPSGPRRRERSSGRSAAARLRGSSRRCNSSALGAQHALGGRGQQALARRGSPGAACVHDRRRTRPRRSPTSRCAATWWLRARPGAVRAACRRGC